MEDRIVSGQAQSEDSGIELSLRPRRLVDYVGQSGVIENLKVAIEAATRRKEPLDHLLFYGPPGLGKTTLANIIGNEMGVSVRVTSGPAIERPGDMAAILTNLQRDDILFIDEIHRLSRVVEEVLYPAMEDSQISWVMGRGLGARSINLRIPPFTLIGATTRYAMVSSPLRNRFGSVYRLDYYSHVSVQSILARSAIVLGIEASDEGLSDIAARSRGTPRIANRLLKRVRDYAEVKANGIITKEVAVQALDMLELDRQGLDSIDHSVLKTLAEKFDGGPVGLDTIAASIGEEADTVMDVYEPYLIQLGLLGRTPRGRIATRKAYEYLGLPINPRSSASQQSLWDSLATSGFEEDHPVQ